MRMIDFICHVLIHNMIHGFGYMTEGRYAYNHEVDTLVLTKYQ